MKVDLRANVLVMDDGTIIRLCGREAEVAHVMVTLGAAPMDTIANKVWSATSGAVPMTNAKQAIFALRRKLKAHGFDVVKEPARYSIQATRRAMVS